MLSFWIGELDEAGRADVAHTKRWFARDAALDEEIRSRFAELHGELRSGGHADWRTSDPGLLAAILVLDQFSRNMFRGTAKAFAADGLALELARTAVAAGVDRRLRYDERTFVYMPYMHSEDRATQAESVALFEKMVRRALARARRRRLQRAALRDHAPGHRRALRALPAPERRAGP